MRLLVVKERWPDRGGGELATRLILRLLKDSFDVVVLTGEREEREPGIQYIYHPALGRGNRHELWPLMGLADLSSYIRAADVVYIPRYAYPAIPLAKKLGKRVVVHLHGYAPISYTSAVYAPYELERRRTARRDVATECRKGPLPCLAAGPTWWMPRLVRRWLALADAVICVSKRHASIVAAEAPELRGKIRVVYNPPPPETVEKRPADLPTFIYTGGGEAIKGFHIAAKAAKALGEGGIRAVFYLTGRYGHREAQLIEAIRAKYPNLRVELLGHIPREELVALHSRAWARLVPSIWEETFSYAVVESALWETLPIASAVGAIPEMLEGTPAMQFTVPPREIPQKALEVAQASFGEIRDAAARTKEAMRAKLDERAIKARLVEVLAGRG